MKTLFSLPKDDGFFNRYATLIPTLRKLGYLAQVVSALTEIGVIYAVMYSSLADFWPSLAIPIATLGAILGTAFLEIGLRQFIPYSARAILYRRFAGLDRLMTVFILSAAVGLLLTSGLLSFKGSKSMVEAVAPAPKLQTSKKADKQYHLGRTEAQKAFQQDSAEIAGRYAGLIEAQRRAYAARISGERQALAALQTKERTTGQSYISAKTEKRTQIANLQADAAGTVAALEAQKAGEMGKAAGRKTEALQRLTGDHSQARQDITERNTAAVQKTETKVRQYGNGLAWFTVVCLIVLVLAVSLEEIHQKGSGIEQVAQPNQYHFSEGVAAAFLNMLSDKWNYHARTWIKRWAERTPAPPRPAAPPTLYELADWKPLRIRIPAAHPDTLTNGNGKAGNNGTAAKNMADRSGSISATIPAEKAGADLAFNNASRYDPDTAAADGAAVEVVEVDKSLKPCQHCEAMFRARTTWQKFCSEQCKLAHHEAKRGGRFDPKKYHEQKRRKGKK